MTISVLDNPEFPCPEEILGRQIVLGVRYFSFDGHLHTGQIVVDKRLESDILKIFDVIERERFPLSSVIPASDERFSWDDEAMMELNNTSGFNYRSIANSDKLSAHAFGQAIDINPQLNPFIMGGEVKPRGARRDISKPGTIMEDGFLVRAFAELGWEWGGSWGDRKDWHHFQKILDN